MRVSKRTKTEIKRELDVPHNNNNNNNNNAVIIIIYTPVVHDNNTMSPGRIQYELRVTPAPMNHRATIILL